jgi:hypothetical protein
VDTAVRNDSNYNLFLKGITINWGYVVACADVNTHEGNELVIFAMMLGLFWYVFGIQIGFLTNPTSCSGSWTMVYDTVYACQV